MCKYCDDLDRYRRELAELQATGLTEDHPLIRARRRRMAGARLFAEAEHGEAGLDQQA